MGSEMCIRDRKEDGRIIVETHKDEDFMAPSYESVKEAVYGTIKVNVLVKEG